LARPLTEEPHVTEWTKLDDDDGEAHAPFYDPYLTFAQLTNYEFTGGKPKSFPVLLELTTDLKEFASLRWDTNNESLAFLALTPGFKNPPPPLDKSTFCVAVVSKEFFVRVRKWPPLMKMIRRFEAGTPVKTLKTVGELNNGGIPDANAAKRQSTPSQRAQANAAQQRSSQSSPIASAAPASQPSVVIGVIDDGIAFANERFAYIDSAGTRRTRIDAFWGQDLPPLAVGFANPLSGWTLDATAIDQLTKTYSVGTAVDEDAVYRAGGLNFGVSGHKAMGRRAAHGTHVMDLACGHDPQTAAAAQAPPIVAVQLPAIVTEQTSGLRLTPFAFAGLWFILMRALAMTPQQNSVPLPVVVNLSYGTTSGPHDGSSLLEAGMDLIIRLCWVAANWRVSIVLPSGNSLLSRLHACPMLPAMAYNPVPLVWKVQPDDRTPSFVELWMPCETAFRDIEFKVQPPGAAISGPIKEGSVWAWPTLANLSCLVIYPGFSSLGSRRMAIICLLPTATIKAGSRTAPAGEWRVFLGNNAATARVVDGWVGRDDNAFGFPVVGRQSRFEDPKYVRFGSFGLPEENDVVASQVARARTINGIATGARTVVVGGCRAIDLKLVSYTAVGPVSRPQGCALPSRYWGADVTAPSEHSIGCGGVLATGTRSHSTVAINGTSVAAPQVTRRLAELMAAGGSGDRFQAIIEAIAQEISRVASIPPLIPPLEPVPNVMRGGAGRIELPGSELPPANGKRPPQYR
jgi:hypothetical protein